MRVLTLVGLLALAIPLHRANASSHREAPARGTSARTVTPPSALDQVIAWLTGEDAKPLAPHQGEVQVQRPGFTPSDAR